MGAYSGFNVGWANASTIGTAQPIAELPIFSGFSVRVVLNIINFRDLLFLYDPLHENHQGGSEEELKL